jgi:hypothetical protein
MDQDHIIVGNINIGCNLLVQSAEPVQVLQTYSLIQPAKGAVKQLAWPKIIAMVFNHIGPHITETLIGAAKTVQL